MQFQRLNVQNTNAAKKEELMPIKSKIRTVPDYPKKGIMFRDITTLIKDPVGFRLVIDSMTQRYITSDVEFDTIVGIESRGFIIGGALSYTLGKGFIPIRKKGKLPADTIEHEYALEYGTDVIEIHKDALKRERKSFLWMTSLQQGALPWRRPRLSRNSGPKLRRWPL